MTSSTYLLITNLWNEQDSVPNLFRNIENQSCLPKLWIWINDGSTDNSSSVIRQEAANSPIPIHIFELPRKVKGNLDTIGLAYNTVLPQIQELTNVDYVSIADVDTAFPLDYFERVSEFMDNHPSVGACAGQNKGETKRMNPMGGGKFIRWSIIERIDQFWELAPDSFLNIMALRRGYSLRTLDDLEVTGGVTTINTKSGRYRYGRRSFYSRLHILLVLRLGFLMMLRSMDGTEFLRGYFHEWSKGTWTCENKVIRYFYSLEYRVRDWFKKHFDIGRHNWP